MFYALLYALNRKWDVMTGVAEMAGDVLSGATKWHGMFVQGVKSLWDALSGEGGGKMA